MYISIFYSTVVPIGQYISIVGIIFYYWVEKVRREFTIRGECMGPSPEFHHSSDFVILSNLPGECSDLQVLAEVIRVESVTNDGGTDKNVFPPSSSA